MFHAAAVLKRPTNNPHSVEHDGSLPRSQEPIRRHDFFAIHVNNMVRSTKITAVPTINTPVKVGSVKQFRHVQSLDIKCVVHTSRQHLFERVPVVIND
jgi:hypothetical protein